CLSFFSTHWLNPYKVWVSGWLLPPQIANRLFKSIEKLEYLLHILLNEGQLIIKLGRKIKNKGNGCITV
ncbi:hypothetical protein QUB56_33760, partial [Microcoleus sp. AR_TQ3_B6]